MDVVVEKANDLMSVTGDNSIPSYIEEVMKMYNAMCAKSEVCNILFILMCAFLCIRILLAS